MGMSRLPELRRDQLSAAGQAVWDLLVETRGCGGERPVGGTARPDRLCQMALTRMSLSEGAWNAPASNTAPSSELNRKPG
jgi:hypothetical protein